MNDHIPDATKMIQGTPRMDSALRRSQEDYTESYLLTEGLKLERELNAANAIIRQQQLLEEENLRLKDRIKRLEEAGDALMEIVEGARSERWNVNGFRLKDTPEWVQFYVSFRKAKRSKWKEAKP